ncbi:TIGR04086 family membrane protein [Tissierella praeacuta]|uniref:Putative membrane protein, TIGR04086 family n=1 Tax=Tissierella praeacuta DSM 18095 TaxID=1123404 RepID=A0A1M4ZEK3_9FIRM|nr:TIGR04086 family membrane protein [Tissierella praeacuta]MBU5257425.1 TIGR04086 family membrane protein [Tissierella praeacuta]TCU65369.1 putative membrane protein (TIGR04086 family) [Tissierella praeacuta]SHF16489.1 putative membrane protein, TIGR04086 family [Tissierella praeacuta DSM 18095]SUP01926.1 putative membrane protein [Tissierella praeacuta]
MKTKNLDRGIHLLRGLLLAYIITCILILFFSLLLTYSSLKENKMPLMNTVIMMLSIIVGSIYVSKGIKEKGWINGGIVGIVYYSILIILNLIFLKSLKLDIFSISKLALACITGIIGGIIGINIS